MSPAMSWLSIGALFPLAYGASALVVGVDYLHTRWRDKGKR